MTPVSGQWTFGPVTTLISTSSKQVFSNVTHSFASLDPAFHASPVNVGTVRLDVPGPYLGTLTLDTTTLSNGVHKLFLRADSFVSPSTVFVVTDPNIQNPFSVSNPFPGGTNSGVLLMPFCVQNPQNAAAACVF